MPFDAYFLSASMEELSSAEGAKIDKVQQPARDTVILTLRLIGENRRLLICVNPNSPRLQYTELSFENPAVPPMFCMLLRKHLVGARITGLRQTPMERIVTLTLDGTDELGEESRRYLILELMGRNANLILCDSEKRIIDCLRRVDIEMSPERQVLPGLFYRDPPAPDKRDPLTLSRQDFLALLRSPTAPVSVERLLQNSLNGLSPLLCRELCCRICGETDRDVQSLPDLPAAAQTICDFFRLPKKPVMLSEDGVPKDFSAVEILQYGDFRTRTVYPTWGSLLDDYYGRRERSERQRQRAQNLNKTVTVLRDRTARKLVLQRKELSDSRDRELLRRNGDLIMANLYRIRKGDVLLCAEDFYDPEQKPREIRLLPHLNGQQNAARYYKDYQRAKSAEINLTGRIAAGEQELSYLNSVLEELSRAETDRDLSEIREELVSQGYVRDTDRKKQQKQKQSRPMEFISSTGMTILVGRNNRQNDLLTLKLADRRDVWLHAQKVHGSHVIVASEGETPDDTTLTEAAMLAAWFSQAKDGQNVPVDTTRVKNVKKPAGALPGMVVYEGYRTIYVTPEEKLAERLRGKDRL